MNELLKTIKSIFAKDKLYFCTKYTNEISMVYDTVSKRVSYANSHSYKYVFSVIYLSDDIIIKCQTYNNISSWTLLNSTYCRTYSKEKLADYIDKELNVLANEVDSSYNCYKVSKNEKDN